MERLLRLPGYRRREGQAQLMASVYDTMLAPGRQLVVEAPTGTGKTDGLLLPALLATEHCRCRHPIRQHEARDVNVVDDDGRRRHSRKLVCRCGCHDAEPLRVVIATYSNLLAARAALESAPRVEAALGFSPRTFLAKGRANYVCLERLRAHAPGDQQRQALERAAAAVEGDLDRMGGGAELREAISDKPRYCLGPSCEYVEQCYSARARKAIKAARVIVTTQAFLMADIRANQAMIGGYDVVMIDEAQHLPDVATGALTASLDSGALRRVAQRSGLPQAVRDALGNAAAALESLPALHPSMTRETVVIPEVPNEIQRSLDALDNVASSINWSNLHGAERRAAVAVAEVSEQAGDISRSLGSKGMVLYAAQRDGRVTLSASPLGVAGYLRRNLYFSEAAKGGAAGDGDDQPERLPRSVVAVSATLRSIGEPDGFGYFMQRAGLKGDVAAGRLDAQVLTVTSPFPRDRALVYVPPDTPPPPPNGAVSDRFAAAVVAELLAVQQSVGGGAIVLCTSWAWLGAMRTALLAQYPAERVFAQAEGGSADVVLDRFLAGPPGSILVGTKRFWEGIDVPGERIRTVVVPRLPFANPNSDVLLRARCERMDAFIREKNSDRREIVSAGFSLVLMPEMLITLRQGAGRLIRTETDWGVILLYDARCRTKTYGRQVLKALGYRVARARKEVHGFASALHQGSAGS